MLARSSTRLFHRFRARNNWHTTPWTTTAALPRSTSIPFYLRNAAIRAFSQTCKQSNDAAESTTQSPAQSQQAISASDADLLKSLPPEKPDQPSYALVFTCKKCSHRSAHRISKQGYSKGTVLIQCSSCKNRHLIADNLKIFSDKRVTLEQILAEKGALLQKGSVGADGDLEIWDDAKGDDVKALG